MWPQLIIVTLLAAIAQGVAGFGFTLLAVSFYLLILQSTDAVQLVLLMNFTISMVLVSRLWRLVPRRLWMLMAGGGLLGFPVGLWIFARADLDLVGLAIAVVTIGFAAVVMVQEVRATATLQIETDEEPDYRPASALVIGAAAGTLTASLGAPGPPVALYLSSLGLDKTRFRALALSTFVVMQLGSIIGQVAYVGVDTRVWTLALVLAPTAVIGAAIGHRLCRFVSERNFRRGVLLMLLATGVYMLYRALAL